METGAESYKESYKDRANREKKEMQKKKDAAVGALGGIRNELEKAKTVDLPFKTADKALDLISRLCNTDSVNSFVKANDLSIDIVSFNKAPSYKGKKISNGLTVSKYGSWGRDKEILRRLDDYTKGVLATLTPNDIIGKFNGAISGSKVRRPAPR